MSRPTPTENRYAVCIGINDYQPSAGLSSLAYAEADAQAMDALLDQLGFEQDHRCLLLGEAATLSAVNEALSTLILDRPGEHDLVIFYFAGHSLPLVINDSGVQQGDARKSEVFLTTYDFDRQKIKKLPSFRKQQALGMERLRTTFFAGEEGSRRRLFLFDSCYSGDFFGATYRDDEANPVQSYIKEKLSTSTYGRVALSSCLPVQRAAEDPALGHGRFTYYVLEALSGRAEAFNRDGRLTVNGLFEYLTRKLPAEQRPVLSGVQQDTFELVYYPDLAQMSKHVAAHEETQEDKRRAEKAARLRAMFADHTSFMRDRLESFVGRETELSEIRQHIQDQMPTGGYVTITGQAGQGKSSIIAQLVKDYIAEQGSEERVAYHFIPFRPGPDHQVGLLRNLMARLILKYNLLDLYVTSESRPALRDAFPHVLTEVAKRGGQEIIFVDGLDQLEEDATGVRDLTFLPNGSNQPPDGIVFVLGTRPNDTLRPLELLKPHHAYVLPNLSREDFDLILCHRGASLERGLANRFYQVMQENALYLDLVAQELAKLGTGSPEVIIERIAADPDNLFSLSLDRLKRSPLEWREVLKPILALLLAAREPLSGPNIRHILHLDHDRLSDGLRRLGGLVIYDGMGRYTLFHLKFYDYLREDRNKPSKEYIFAQDEEEDWHQRLACWCEQGDIQQIWQDMLHLPAEQGRRLYARKHYITHLHHAHAWQKLFDILDKGSYGKEKVKHDPTSTRAFVLDVDWGCQAATAKEWNLQEEVQHLPHLWRYTLLRTSLISRAEQYPEEAFLEMLLSGEEDKAIGFAELITNLERKAALLLLIAQYLVEKPNHKVKSIQTFTRVEKVISEIKSKERQSELFYALARTLLEAQIWDKAQSTINLIETSQLREIALQRLAEALAQDQQWEQTKSVVTLIKDEWRQSEVLATLAAELAQAQLKDQAWSIIEAIKLKRVRVTALRNIATVFVKFQLWSEAERAITSIEHNDEQTTEFQTLAITMAKTQLWSEAERISNLIENEWHRGETLCSLAILLAQDKLWSEAMRVATQITHKRERTKAFEALTLLQKHIEINNTWNQILQEEKQQEKIPTYTHQWKAIIVPPEQQWHFNALHELADTLIQAQQWNVAEHIVYAMEDKKVQADLLQKLSMKLVNVGRLQQARKVISKFTMNYEQTKILIALGEAFTDSGNLEEALQVLQEVQKVISTIAMSDSGKRTKELRDLAKVLIKAKQWQQAKEVINSIQQSYEQAQALRELGQALMQAGEWLQAEAMINSMVQGDEQARALRELGQALMQAQQKEQALRAWQRAEVVIKAILSRGEQAKAFCELGLVLIQAQEWQRARAVINSMARGDEQARALRELGQALMQAQQKEQALRAWQRAEVVIKATLWGYERARALRELGQALLQAQQKEQALRIWQQAEAVIKAIKQSEERIQALHELAQALLQAQQKEQALRIWQQAEEVISSITGRVERARALRELGQALLQAQQKEQALRIWKRAAEVISFIQWIEEQSARGRKMRRELIRVLGQAQEWQRAEATIGSIKSISERAEALYELGQALTTIKKDELLLHLVQRWWLQASTRDEALSLLSLANGLVHLQPEISTKFYEAFAWVDSFLEN